MISNKPKYFNPHSTREGVSEIDITSGYNHNNNHLFINGTEYDKLNFIKKPVPKTFKKINTDYTFYKAQNPFENIQEGSIPNKYDLQAEAFTKEQNKQKYLESINNQDDTTSVNIVGKQTTTPTRNFERIDFVPTIATVNEIPQIREERHVLPRQIHKVISNEPLNILYKTPNPPPEPSISRHNTKFYHIPKAPPPFRRISVDSGYGSTLPSQNPR